MAGVGLLVFSQVAFGAVTVAFNASVSPNKAGKPTGLKMHIASSDAAARSAPDHEPDCDQAERRRPVQRQQVPEVHASALSVEGPERLSVGLEDRLGQRRRVRQARS